MGLGSNLGDRETTLRRAIQAIQALPGARLLGESQLRETAPVGGPPQGPYLNAAVLVELPGDPAAVLQDLLRIERAAGRERRERWGPRTLDLDLLFSPELILDTPELTLPHPRLRERRFALEPLVEVAPWAADPGTSEPYQEALAALRDQAPVAQGATLLLPWPPVPRYGLPLSELPLRLSDALDVVERGQGRTVLLREGAPIAALVSLEDLDRADPPDPGLGGADPLLALCGSCHADWFVDQVLSVYGVTPPRTGSPQVPPPVPSSQLRPSDPLKQRTVFEGPLPPRPR